MPKSITRIFKQIEGNLPSLTTCLNPHRGSTQNRRLTMFETLPLAFLHYIIKANTYSLSLSSLSATTAMTDATSEPAADWVQLFHRASSGIHLSHPPHPFIATSIPADSTVVTTAPATAAVGGMARSIGKAPPRKRSRASRRAPTTLLNTDTTNFRAMVQQFTGVPTGPYSTDRFGFGFRSENPIRQPPSAMPQQQRQYYQYRPPQQEQEQHQQQQQDMMHMGYGMVGNGMDDGQVMPGFFIDGMGHGYTNFSG